ncbi:hypothetical protein TPHA_0H00630 [Tetrapisispora phaffii CBS 4417]|uniref:Glutaredoxin domain-containing protein n=1 Tax=Tetrapisispora phaffii (strain ATCC 24235 / CBS 4417 / NBRC 1672 / NRRL Y-8282 / UCD 70-5) TaxID=1071381 RepID=G8BWW9_TETPH|nr:hypothetical protein TPHA_0H00630 [Tetrapisispora phaffii CBS 4417]CCE64273.1 hypothetical protein TPHA_0H00630 [Tetrapisispora phaffii CBS 4417]
MSLMNKRNVRILSITGLLLFVVFLFVQNDNWLLESVVSDSSASAPSRTAERVRNNEAPRPIVGGSSSGKFDPAQEYINIMEMAPVVLFSKTFCPYCKRLKKLLADNYRFSPDIKIIELDKHPNGDELFSYIKQQTSHTTVPNLIVNGKSLGGFDSIKKLQDDKLVEQTIQKDSDFSVIVSSKDAAPKPNKK